MKKRLMLLVLLCAVLVLACACKQNPTEEQLFAKLRAGEIPEGISEENGVFRYTCEISDTQMLYVTVQRNREDWCILQWQAVSTVDWQEDDYLPVWDGETIR